jgi:predicted transcriptional regulator
MPTQSKPEFIAIPEEARQVIREARTLVGLSRTALEQRAKVGTDYIKKLELGRRPSAEATRLRRVLRIIQQAATRGKAPAKLQARIARVLKAVEQPSQRSTAR